MAKKSRASTPEVLEALEEEVGLVLSDSNIVQRFALNVKQFFKTAAALEVKAKENLAEAQRLTVPTSMQEDERIQKAIKAYGADKKDALEHWDISLKVSQFHKRLVGARKRSEEPNEQAVAIATRLHNTYTENERRRVAAENERIRREAEEKARQDRARELAEMERQALEADAQSAALSEREQTFVTLYMSYGDGVRAARQAGYKDPETWAARLLSLPKIHAACDAQKKAAVIREQAAAKKEQPLEVQVDEVKAQVSRAYGSDRTTKSGELLDEIAFRDAVIEGKYGIPRDVLIVNPAKLNEYARSMGELIDRWPGVRLKKSTSLV